MRLTQAQADAINIKNAPKRAKVEPEDAFEGKESELHSLIEQDLKRRRWYYVHSRTDKRATNQLGTPDFIIATPSRQLCKDCGQDAELPTTYWIEVKRKGGKLSREQTITKHVLQALRHNWACVYSFDEYLTAIGAK